MSTSPDYKLVTIELETVFGQEPAMDKLFTDYLGEYSIIYKVLESEQPTSSGFPVLQYVGGPISLTNMLKEKFGFSDSEIASEFPQIAEALPS